MAVYTTIDDPEAYFQVVTYTGDGSANHAITLPGDTDMQPDLVWIKNRDATDAPCLFDSIRGATKLIVSHTSVAETTDTDTLDSFTSDGFQVDADVQVNTDTEKYVAWCWKATGSTASNTNGTNITSTVDANTTSGFSIVSWTGDNSGSSTVGHGLGKTPEVIHINNRPDGADWQMKHKDFASGESTEINNNGAPSDRNGSTNGGIADLSGTTTFGFIAGSAGVPAANGASDAMIAYAWNSVQGFSKIGSYEGNGNADGTFVYTGFRPAFVMTQSIDSTSNREIFDNKREGYNVDNDALLANATTVEATADQIDLLSNGFKFRIATDPNVAETYVYMAFAEAPFVNSEGVPCNAR